MNMPYSGRHHASPGRSSRLRAGTRVLLVSTWLAAALLVGCKDREAEAAAQAAAQAAASEQSAAEAERNFNAAVGESNWQLAKAQADVLLANWPDTEAAKRVRAQFDDVKAKGDAEREARRVASLWAYNIETVTGGKQLSAAIYAKDELDVDGSGKKPVRLIFRDHPSWGRSSYLVLQAGDFDCYGSCRVNGVVGGGAPQATAPNRPKTDEAIAMFVDDNKSLWRMTRDAKRISIEFPVKAGGTRTAVFEVAGLDRSKLPGWD